MKILLLGCLMALNFSKPLPKAIQKLQAEFCKEACVHEACVYIFKTKQSYFYVLHPGACKPDRLQPVYNAKGQCLGSLGGLSGNFVIQGVNFSQLHACDSVLWCR